jgi:two-component system, chemotaxis family, chemotaxis protein CheY
MKTLIVEDDFTSRILIQEFLKEFGAAHIAVDGKEAVDAVDGALSSGAPYDLICMDIMMPEMDGQDALKLIRARESEAGILPGKGAKVFMTTALSDPKNVLSAFREQCDAYLVKPIDRTKLVEQLRLQGLVK